MGHFQKHSEETKQKMRLKKIGIYVGSNHPNWKGGRAIDKDGYILIYKPEHPFCNCHGYIFEHRLVMEKMISRYLKPKERVHHKGIKYPIGSIENKQDNRPKNLQLFANNGEHAKFHNFGK